MTYYGFVQEERQHAAWLLQQPIRAAEDIGFDYSFGSHEISLVRRLHWSEETKAVRLEESNRLHYRFEWGTGLETGPWEKRPNIKMRGV